MFNSKKKKQEIEAMIKVLKEDIVRYEKGYDEYSSKENAANARYVELAQKLRSVPEDSQEYKVISREMNNAYSSARNYATLAYEQHNVLEELRAKLNNLQERM